MHWMKQPVSVIIWSHIKPRNISIICIIKDNVNVQKYINDTLEHKPNRLYVIFSKIIKDIQPNSDKLYIIILWKKWFQSNYIPLQKCPGNSTDLTQIKMYAAD